MHSPPVPSLRSLPRGTLTAQWIVLVTVCVLLFQALLGGPVLPKGIGLGDTALSLCTDAGMAAAGEGSAARHDCGVFCQTACAAAPVLLRAAVLLPLPGAAPLRGDWDTAARTPAPDHPPLRQTARGPPLFL